MEHLERVKEAHEVEEEEGHGNIAEVGGKVRAVADPGWTGKFAL